MPRDLLDTNFEHIWERKAGETTRAYAAFNTYLKLEPYGRGFDRRTIRNTLIKLHGTYSSGKYRQMLEWSRKNNWVLRAVAYDEYIAKEEQATHIEAVRTMAARHVKIAQGMMQLAVQRLQQLKIDDLDTDDVRSWILDAVKLERLSLGEPEEIQKIKEEISIEEIDYSKMTTDQLKAMLARRLLMAKNE